MKNSEIHAGLDRKEIRDFLSTTLVEVYYKECENKKVKVEYKGKGYSTEWAILDCEQEIIFQQKRLKLLREKFATMNILNMCGWCEFDVSDETINDTGLKSHMNFIGTIAEFENYIANIVKPE